MKIYLGIFFGASEYMLHSYDKLEEFWVQGPTPKHPKPVPRQWLGRIR